MFRIECVLDPDRNIPQFHVFRRLGMDRLHIHVRQLVRNIEIGVADDLDFVHTHQFRVARGKVEFLVDDSLAGLRQHGQTAERN